MKKEEGIKLTFNPVDMLSECFKKISEEEIQIRFVTNNGKVSSIGINILKLSSDFLRKLLSDTQLNIGDITIYLPDVEEVTLDKVADVIKTGRTFISNPEEAENISVVAQSLGIQSLKLDNLEVISERNYEEEEEYFECDSIKREKVDPGFIKVETSVAANIYNVKAEDIDRDEANRVDPLILSFGEKVMEKEHIENKRHMEREPIENKRVMEREPSDSKRPMERKPIDNQRVMERKPIETRRVVEREPIENMGLMEREPIENERVMEGEPIETRRVVEREPVEKKRVEREPIETRRVVLRESIDNKRVMERKPIEIRRVVEREPIEKRKGMANETIGNRVQKKYDRERSRNRRIHEDCFDRIVKRNFYKAPKSNLSSIQYVYRQEFHKRCHKTHRRIDPCPLKVHTCGKSHTPVMYCNGSWKPLRQFEKIILNWRTTK